MSAAEKYLNIINQLYIEIMHYQNENIEKAANMCAHALKNDGMIFTFGTGHSHILAEEIFYRAGGLVRVCPILEDSLMLHRGAARSSEIERLPGIASLLLNDIDCVSMGGVMFIFSNSGRNTVSVDMAIEAGKHGLKTICVTNMKHSAAVESRHPSGKKLYEVCDLTINNMGCYGDAAVEIGGRMTGPTSTVIGALIMNAIVCRTVELVGDGAEVFYSANTDGGDEANARYIKKYKGIIRSL